MTTPRPHRTSRWKRPNVWLGKLIPSLICVFGFYGYRLVLFDVYPWLKSQRPLLARFYLAHVNVFLGLVAWSYALVYLKRPNVNERVPLDVQEKRVVFACDAHGEPLRCYRDGCDGSYLSIRTRHCRDCQTCHAGFDHHCSFMDNCVATSSTFKPFVDFILFAVLLLVVALVPLSPLQYRALREVIATTWDTAEMKQEWWSKWYSWAGGPVWRVAGAVILGYRQYPSVSSERPFLVTGHMVKTFTRDGVQYAYDASLYPRLATPTWSSLVIVAFATLIVAIGIAMLIAIALNARKGLSAVQVERIRRYRLKSKSGSARDACVRLWIPFDRDRHGKAANGDERLGAVVSVDPDAPLYDFGPMENWKKLMGDKWWEWFIPTRMPPHDDTVINASVLQHLRILAQKSE